MDHDYPEHLLAREPAPAYSGEGAFAPWHYSENPGLGRFRPRTPAANRGADPLVWAVDTRHAPRFWFPRDCPRGCIWPVSTTTAADRERFFGHSDATRIHVIEAGRPGCGEQVDAVERVVLDDLPGRPARAGIELRVTPSIWPFWRRVTESTVDFSGSRLANAAPHADQFGKRPDLTAGAGPAASAAVRRRWRRP
jgi:hypothetical protein